MPSATIIAKEDIILYDLCHLRQILLDVKKIEDSIKKETSLTLNEALCICQSEKGLCDPSSLAKELSLSPSRMTRILDSLYKDGYINRTQNDDDRRAITITLTHKGKEMNKKLHSLSLELPQYVIDLATQTEQPQSEQEKR